MGSIGFQNKLACVLAAITIFLFFVFPIARPMINRLLGKSSEPVDDDEELCVSCGYDARNLLRCPECGKPTREALRQRLAKLRDDWPTQSIAHRIPNASEQPMVILTTDDGRAADLLRQHLLARGISANLNRVKKLPGAIYSTARDSYRLTVWSADEERGRAIINHLWPEEIRGKNE